MKNVTTMQKKLGSPAKKPAAGKMAVLGPSLFEIEYLRQMKEEWELSLRSKSFSTLLSFEIVFQGADYQGSMKVTA